MEFDFRQQPGLRRWNRDLVKENTQNPIVTIITPYFNGGGTLIKPVTVFWIKHFLGLNGSL